MTFRERYENNQIYWNSKGKYQQENDILHEHVPLSGPVTGGIDTIMGSISLLPIELMRCVTNMYYDHYNNGSCNWRGDYLEIIDQHSSLLAQTAQEEGHNIRRLLSRFHELMDEEDCPSWDCHRGEVDCSECGGEGSQPCDECDGLGEFEDEDDEDGSGPCLGCDGKGEVYCHQCGGDGSYTCEECDGEGRRMGAYTNGSEFGGEVSEILEALADITIKYAWDELQEVLG